MNALTTIRAAETAPTDLVSSYGAYICARLLRDICEHEGDDHGAARHDARALKIAGDMIAAMVSMTRLTAEQLREVLA